MKKTEIVCVLDRSGSMHSCLDDAIGGFNTFLAEQQALEGECTMSVHLFDSQHTTLCECQPIKEVEALTRETFVPRGQTALLDAIGLAVDGLGVRLREMPERDRPEKVLVVILTDGHENASREYSHERVQAMIKHQREKYDWEFIFLSASLDASEYAKGLSIDFAASYVADGQGTQDAYASVSRAATSARVRGSVQQSDLDRP